MGRSFPAVEQSQGSTSSAQSAASSASYPALPSSGHGQVRIDASPIDPTSDDGAHWLLACLWPDNLARFTRFREALATRARPRIRRRCIGATSLTTSPGWRNACSPSDPLIVFHSWVAAYLSPQRQRELVAAVQRLAHVPDGALPVCGGVRRDTRTPDATFTVTPPHVASGDGPRSFGTGRFPASPLGRHAPPWELVAVVAYCRRTPWCVTTGRNLHPVVTDHRSSAHSGAAELVTDRIDRRRGIVPRLLERRGALRSSSRPSPRSKDNWSPPAGTRPDALTPRSLIPSPGSIPARRDAAI